MSISVNWLTRVITVPQSFLTQTGPTSFELDLNEFRLTLKALEADPTEGIVFPTTHNHNTQVVISGTTIARVVELINNYTITFEDGAYTVNIAGGNSNIGDVSNFNQVRVNSNNSAGLQVVETRAALTEEQDHSLRLLRKFETNRTRVDRVANTLTVYDDDQVTPLHVFDLSDDAGAPSVDDLYERSPTTPFDASTYDGGDTSTDVVP